jgi:hypothetical protein
VAPHSAAAKRTRRITWKRYSPIRCRQNVNYPNQCRLATQQFKSGATHT